MKILAEERWRATAESPQPDVSFVKPMERRRLSPLERAALSVAWKVYPHGEEVPVVFAMNISRPKAGVMARPTVLTPMGNG
jgi:hypothetical protein